MVVGGMCGCGGHVWLWGGMHRIPRDAVNERAVCILLECILVCNCDVRCAIVMCDFKLHTYVSIHLYIQITTSPCE